MGKREDLEQTHRQLNNYLSTLSMSNASLNTLSDDFSNLTSAWHTNTSAETLQNISSELQDIVDAAAEVQKQYNRLKGLHTNLRIDKISIGNTDVTVNTPPSH